MTRDPRPIVYVHGAWTQIEAPTASELEMAQTSPQVFAAARLAELHAWIDQVYLALSDTDRDFLRTNRIAAWQTEGQA